MKPYYKTDFGKLYCNDCTTMKLPYVDLTVTSPPYDDLREYNKKSKFTFKKFKAMANLLFKITRPGGIVVWVVADETRNFCESLSSFKQAIYFVKVGFNLLDTMIYHKIALPPMYPYSRRYTPSFEYMFVFSKGRPNTFHPLKELKKAPKSNKIVGAKKFTQKDGTRKGQHSVSFSKYKIKDNIWSYHGIGKYKTKGQHHPAIFPEQLAADHILTWTNKGDIVLDIMAGAGTTCLEAEKLKRRWIGIEIDPDYCKEAKTRIEQEVKMIRRKSILSKYKGV